MADPTDSEPTNASAAATMKGDADDGENHDRIVLKPAVTNHVCQGCVSNGEGAVCYKSFETVEVLAANTVNEHLHSREQQAKPKFQWLGCGSKTFREKRNFMMHLRQHTGESPLKCKHHGCGRAFRRSRQLKVLEETHTERTCFECPKLGCSNKNLSKRSLWKHRVRHHPSDSNVEVANAAGDHHYLEAEETEEDNDIPFPSSSLEVNPRTPPGECEGSPFSVCNKSDSDE
eukprot:scpid86736/ scgid9950/ Pair-rule protein odd-paired